ncbi:MAG: CDP-glycerol glycerophosphotransferase family protein [Clostridia bacterium]|nr:CDP-glycerol glycerophosphotransferase family protein [Clostridia bacterium]
MKTLFFLLFAAVFNLCRIFPLRKNSVVFISMHNAKFNDTLGFVREEIRKRNEYKCYSFSRTDIDLSKGIKSIGSALKFFTVNAFRMATAKYIFLNDNFMPMAYLNINKKACVVQLWHAEGAFKKFGLDINQPEEIRKREAKGYSKLSYVVCSSKGVAPIYAGAFGMEESRVLPLGAPRTDYYFRGVDAQKLRAEFDEKYPVCKDKKLVLYAPTFRDDKEKNKELVKKLDIKAFNEALGDEYVLLIRYHPQVHEDGVNLDGAVDLTKYPNVNELILISDILVTDYSSICMDFSMLDKPTLFYAYDLEEYASDRQFYFDYEEYVPGAVVRTQEELMRVLENHEYDLDKEKNEKFKNFNFDYTDGKSSQRVADNILSR